MGGTLQHGLNVSLINAPSVYIQYFINETWLERYGTVMEEQLIKIIWSAIISVYPVGAVFGAFIAGHLSAKYGREILGSESVWPLLMAFNAIPAFIQLVILPWFPESPRYLLIDKGNRALSINALQRLWGKRDFNQELEEMQAERTAIRDERSRSVWELFRDPSIRSQLVINMMVSFFMQLSGINAIYSYAFEIFYGAGISRNIIPYVSIGTGLIETLMLLICGFFVERTGRKSLLCGGLGFMGLWTGLLTITFALQHLVSWMPYCSLVFIFAYIISYGLGPGGVALILPSEIFLQSDRPAGFVINGFLNWFGLFLLGILFSSMVDSLGYLCFLIFSAVCLVLSVLGSFIIVETRGKTPLEITEEFKTRKLFQNTLLHVPANGSLPQSTVEIIMSTAF